MDDGTTGCDAPREGTAKKRSFDSACMAGRYTRGRPPLPPQDYVQARIAQLFSVFNRRLSMHVPGLPQEAVNKSLAEAFSACPPPEYSIIPLEERDLQLVFRHDCM